MRTLLTSTLLLAAVPVQAEDLTIRAADRWSCVFGDRDVSFSFEIQSRAERPRSGEWFVSVFDKVVKRESVTIRYDGRRGTVTLKVRTPKPRTNVVIPLKITVRVSGVVRSKELFVFPEDPFRERRSALRKMGLSLFDPDGRTATTLTRHNIPYRQLRQVDALSALNRGTLIVGENVSFREYRSLPDQLARLSARGINVICLSPRDVDLPTSSVTPADRTVRLSFESLRRIQAYDRRFDTASWGPDANPLTSTLRLTGDRRGARIQSQKDGEGWAWMQADFADSRLVVCNAAIVKHWDVSPVPRHLLAHLLDDIAMP